jgi:hypothetical protein
MHFMSVEVSTQEFLFPPVEPSESDDYDDYAEELIEEEHSSTKGPRSDVPFTHIYLHDLESLWWVVVWIVFYNEFRPPEQSNEAAMPNLNDVERQLTAARTLFPPIMESTRRRDGFQLFFSRIYQELPNSKHHICSHLNILRRRLIRGHRKVQAKPHSIDWDAVDDRIYNNFGTAFEMLQALKFTLAFIPDLYAELRKKLKRSRAESTRDVEVVAQKKK